MTLIFGWIATGLSLLYKAPQIYKIIKYKNIDGISINSYTCQSLSYCFYLLHGYYINDSPTISMGFISLSQNILIHLLYYRLNKNNNELNQNNNDTDNNTTNEINSNTDQKEIEIKNI